LVGKDKLRFVGLEDGRILLYAGFKKSNPTTL